MRETTFSDLEIIPGKSYLYRHQGSCDHILRFRDVRVANMDLETAKLSGEHYPIVISEARKMRKPCMCCEIHDATTTAYGDNMAVCSPFFWCDSCFNAAHPTEEEKKGTETYPYFFE
jgi:snRNA-activating protein complex subunit 3